MCYASGPEIVDFQRKAGPYGCATVYLVVLVAIQALASSEYRHFLKTVSPHQRFFNVLDLLPSLTYYEIGDSVPLSSENFTAFSFTFIVPRFTKKNYFFLLSVFYLSLIPPPPRGVGGVVGGGVGCGRGGGGGGGVR
jgi:hypothetical protein